MLESKHRAYAHSRFYFEASMSRHSMPESLMHEGAQVFAEVTPPTLVNGPRLPSDLFWLRL